MWLLSLLQIIGEEVPSIDDTLNWQHPQSLGIRRVTDLYDFSSLSLLACKSWPRSPLRRNLLRDDCQRRLCAQEAWSRGSGSWARCSHAPGAESRGRGRAVPEAARGARRGSVSSGTQPWRARAAASASGCRSPGLGAGRRRAREGCGPKRVPRSDPRRVRVLQTDSSKYWRPSLC